MYTRISRYLEIIKLKQYCIIFVSVTSVRVRRSAVSSTTPTPSDDDDDDFDEDESGEEIDDDGKIYKNPRNSPSTLCPRDEEQATLLVSSTKNNRY